MVKLHIPFHRINWDKRAFSHLVTRPGLLICSVPTDFTGCHKMPRWRRTWLTRLWRLICVTIIVMWASFFPLSSGYVRSWNYSVSFWPVVPLSNVPTLVSPSCWRRSPPSCRIPKLLCDCTDKNPLQLMWRWKSFSPSFPLLRLGLSNSTCWRYQNKQTNKPNRPNGELIGLVLHRVCLPGPPEGFTQTEQQADALSDSWWGPHSRRSREGGGHDVTAGHHAGKHRNRWRDGRALPYS